MDRFEKTQIWQKSLGKQFEFDIDEKQREYLRIQFENFRDKASVLAGEIAGVLPEFTVHDISHIDGLWESADMIFNNEDCLNPAEAFVLGGAFLIHDLGMALAAFPNGLSDIKDNPIWTDTVSSILKEKLNHQINKDDFLNLDKTVEKRATEIVLRLLHAKHAEKLATISWKDNHGTEIFLIEDYELRESYGSIIGLIAHSHWWKIEELEERLPKAILGAPGKLPAKWTIDTVKLACILRIADAIQIDDRRAPYFLRAIRNITKYSDVHWNFQQKLYQARVERNRLVFTSKSAFQIDEAESWWLCYDTLYSVDKELRDVDSLLIDTNRTQLNAKGVASIEDPFRLSKLISVSGWQPIDTKIKVTDVSKLVDNLGGKQLYGDNLIVPLRELIQNSSDAIRARRILENESYENGNIIIRIGKDQYGDFLEMEDNGVGMSEGVLKGPLLDFGKSFWGSDLMHKEFPGLESKLFSSTGKYGIGFFSIFMWGQKVSVTSRRYEDSRDSTNVLEFNEGVSSRPILRKAKDHEFIKDGGTKIRIWFSSRDIVNFLMNNRNGSGELISFKELIGKTCPSIDCNVYFEDNKGTTNIIKSNDWLTIKPLTLLKRIIGESKFKRFSDPDQLLLKELVKNIRILKDENGNAIGRAFLYKGHYFVNNKINMEGLVTIGGMSSSRLTGVFGIMMGYSYRASRDIGIPMATEDSLNIWLNEQVTLLSKLNLSFETEINCASIIRALGGVTGLLKFAYCKGKEMNYFELKEYISTSNYDEYIIVHDAAISNFKREHKCNIIYDDNIIYVAYGIPGILQTGSVDHFIRWPKLSNGESVNWHEELTLKGLVLEAIAEVWKMSFEKILKYSKCSTDNKSYGAKIGTFDNFQEVIIDHVDIIKKIN